MNRSNRTEATDEIVGLFFKCSLIVVAVLATFIIAVIVLKEMLGEDETLVDASTVFPASVRNEVRAPEVHFTDVTRQSGISFSHFTGAYGDKLLPETMGSGAAFFVLANRDSTTVIADRD